MKKIIILTSLILTLNLTFSQVPTDGLVGYWSFDGHFDDLSGNENHGTDIGCIFTQDRFNRPNSCVGFDGVNGVITVPHDSSIDFDAFSDDYTISFWFWSINPFFLASNGRFVEKWNNILNTPYTHLFAIFKDSICGRQYDTNTLNSAKILGVFTGEWFNLSLINDVTKDSVYIYLNGILTGNVPNSTLLPTNNISDMTFGNNSLHNRPFSGCMDEIRIYNRVLSEDELLEIVNEIPVSVNDIYPDNIFKVYPNPSSNIFSIQGENITKIEVINELGQIILQTNKTLKIDLSGHPKGVYFIKILTDKQAIIKKLIKH